MSTTPHERESRTEHAWIGQPDGRSNCYSDASGSFTVIAADGADPRKLMRMDEYSAARAFVNRQFDITGDVCAAIRHYMRQPHSRLRQILFAAMARLNRLSLIPLAKNRKSAMRNIQFHYDRSNEFYAQFLDSKMVYSSAYFEHAADSLEKAQEQKLDRICRDLVLRPDERFLDIGCGWGALICHAAEHYRSRAVGCTLSREQYEFAQKMIQQRGLEERVSVNLSDYRDIDGCYDKIASVGMFEHVGRRSLPVYFNKIYSLASPGGLFVNRGVVRMEGASDDPETLFLQKQVFPGSGLVHLSDVIREGQRAGFDVIGSRDARLHYALTCRRWVENLQRNATHCSALVGEATYRTWLLYLAASAVSFEDRRTGAAQVLFEKRR